MVKGMTLYHCDYRAKPAASELNRWLKFTERLRDITSQ